MNGSGTRVDGRWRLNRNVIDIQGWLYANSKDSSQWTPQPYPLSFVRRRKWIHFIDESDFTQKKAVGYSFSFPEVNADAPLDGSSKGNGAEVQGDVSSAAKESIKQSL